MFKATQSISSGTEITPWKEKKSCWILRSGKEVGKILPIPSASKHRLVICQVTGHERLEGWREMVRDVDLGVFSIELTDKCLESANSVRKKYRNGESKIIIWEWPHLRRRGASVDSEGDICTVFGGSILSLKEQALGIRGRRWKSRVQWTQIHHCPFYSGPCTVLAARNVEIKKITLLISKSL